MVLLFAYIFHFVLRLVPTVKRVMVLKIHSTQVYTPFSAMHIVAVRVNNEDSLTKEKVISKTRLSRTEPEIPHSNDKYESG